MACAPHALLIWVLWERALRGACDLGSIGTGIYNLGFGGADFEGPAFTGICGAARSPSVFANPVFPLQDTGAGWALAFQCLVLGPASEKSGVKVLALQAATPDSTSCTSDGPLNRSDPEHRSDPRVSPEHCQMWPKQYLIIC